MFILVNKRFEQDPKPHVACDARKDKRQEANSLIQIGVLDKNKRSRSLNPLIYPDWWGYESEQESRFKID
jgi:hypothetical protein